MVICIFICYIMFVAFCIHFAFRIPLNVFSMCNMIIESIYSVFYECVSAVDKKSCLYVVCCLLFGRPEAPGIRDECGIMKYIYVIFTYTVKILYEYTFPYIWYSIIYLLTIYECCYETMQNEHYFDYTSPIYRWIYITYNIYILYRNYSIQYIL